MKKIGKTCIAVALSVLMAASLVTAQAAAAATDHLAGGVSELATTISDQAWANSIGLDNNPLMDSFDAAAATVTAGVNVYSGNLNVVTDLYKDAASPDMDLQLVYNSKDEEDIGFGKGFRTNFSMNFKTTGSMSEDPLIYTDRTGAQYIFNYVRENSMITFFEDFKGRSVMVPKSYYYPAYVLTDGDEELYFDKQGKLIQTENSTKKWVLEYEDTVTGERLTSISNGAVTHKINYSSDGKVSYIDLYRSVTDQYPATFLFYYDENGLSRVSYPNHTAVTFTCDSASKKLVGINQSSVSYLSTDLTKVSGYTDAAGSATFLYGNSQTVIIDRSGTMSLINFDENGQPK